MNNVDILEQQVFAARKKLSTQEQLMVNDYVENNAVSPVAAWLLWVFLGQFGAHRFLFKKPYAALMLTLEIIGWVTIILIIGLGFLSAVWIWWIVDAFSIQSWLKESRLQAAYKGINQITGKSVEELSGINYASFNGASFVNYSNQPQQPAQPINNQPSSANVEPQQSSDSSNAQSVNDTDGDFTDFSKPRE
ncbi:TM2 domain-containing protein [Apilactobacillus kunkeei]|uniref:TM2 domain-containing protein n=1 Tax=Apilactobacillus TaxID=2767877 RepID=UPI00112D56FE|nr:TM2 domain-containing protein [Apilactobacillus kunkeei]MBX8456151.1 TM2 domain-containing protein [Apilactobacillus kunkeei]MCK8618768.1 TM2 domain-containing protein [Apilactobacillus kunkeei]NBI01300.1 TM2 domain-containing protein [Apilactobacillus kunkeei]QYU54312.1 TM2 domain-containing protein [Apilactobacillus kunkeei]TPR52081.1 TM2 domain-containing protein [Apilactobacillus kunkeei]